MKTILFALVALTSVAAADPAKKAKKISLTNLAKCSALLADAFPDNNRPWHIETCSKAGVVASRNDGERFAVLSTGEVYQVDSEGRLALLATDKR